MVIFDDPSTRVLVVSRPSGVVSASKSAFLRVSRLLPVVCVATTDVPPRTNHNLEDLSITGQSSGVYRAESALTLGQNPALKGVFLAKSRFFHQDQG